MNDLAKALLGWFEANARQFSWRQKSDPYEILVAEIMLQRTRADQVEPVYLSFIRKYPTAGRLSKARTREIRRFFDKLGLQQRANWVIHLAKELVRQFDGRVPADREALLSLPSVGEYMADAILVFAYAKDVAVIDSNVCRVISRVYGLEARGEARKDLRFRELAQSVLPTGKAREFNWAIIDLAALLCTPRKPRCARCPLRDLCDYGGESLKASKVAPIRDR